LMMSPSLMVAAKAAIGAKAATPDNHKMVVTLVVTETTFFNLLLIVNFCVFCSVAKINLVIGTIR